MIVDDLTTRRHAICPFCWHPARSSLQDTKLADGSEVTYWTCKQGHHIIEPSYEVERLLITVAQGLLLVELAQEAGVKPPAMGGPHNRRWLNVTLDLVRKRLPHVVPTTAWVSAQGMRSLASPLATNRKEAR